MLCIGYGEAKRGEGSASADRDPSSVAHLSMRATFSHKGRREEESIRRQWNLVVDEGVQRRLHVHLGVDHAGLLQSKARGEDGFALRRTDAAVSEFGALLELLVDDGFRQ